MARRLAADAAQEKIRQALQNGGGYAAACAQALGGISQPNDILALEYCRALQNTDIVPLILQRQDNGYNSETINGHMASASAIRKALTAGNASWRQAVPESTAVALTTAPPGYDRAHIWQ